MEGCGCGCGLWLRTVFDRHHSPDFMSYADEEDGYPAPGQYGYGKNGPLGANLAMCPQQIAERFDCLAMTLEIPFKATPCT